MSILDRFRNDPTPAPTITNEDTTMTTTEPPMPTDTPTSLSLPDTSAPVGPDAAALAAENAALRAELHERRLTDLLTEAGSMAGLADPTDVLRFVDRAELLDSDGNPSADRVTAAASKLAAERPYLRQPQLPAHGTANGGPQGFGPGVQLTEADLDRLDHTEIERARKLGLLDRMLGLQ